MKKQLLVCAAVLFSFSLFAQITTDQISNFEDGTTQGWSNGASSPNPPTNIPTGGPGGADDNFLEEISAGGGGAGSKMIIQNDEDEWTGDYIAANIANIIFDIKNAGATDLSIRVAMEGGSDDSEMVTSEFIPLPASQTTWTTFQFPLVASAWTVLDGNNTVAEILADVNEIRILSNPNPSYSGEAIAGTMHIDNILAEGALSVDSNDLSTVSIYPVPVRDRLFITSQEQLSNYEIYNVLGSLVIKASIGGPSISIDVSSLKDGMYMIKLNADNNSVTKRFVVSN